MSERDAVGDELNRHPVDGLIQLLLVAERSATTSEIERIRERIAGASFDQGAVAVPRARRGVNYLGRTLGERDEPLFIHLVERVIYDRQWAPGTTDRDYIGDLRRAAGSPDSRLAIYRRRGGAIAAALHQTSAVIPRERLGRGSLSLLVVIYSADRGILVSGYQASSLKTVSIPENARWLV